MGGHNVVGLLYPKFCKSAGAKKTGSRNSAPIRGGGAIFGGGAKSAYRTYRRNRNAQKPTFSGHGAGPFFF